MIRVENLTWEILNFWQSNGVEYCPVHSSVFVSRKEYGEINGLACLGSVPNIRAVVLSPLIASSGLVAMSLINEMERVLSDAGLLRYSFFLNEQTSKEWTEQVLKLADIGIFQRLGISDTGAQWFERHMVPLEDMVMQ